MAVDSLVGRIAGVSYLHIPARDAAASAGFYRDVFSWQLHGLAIYQFGPRLARRGPVVAWEVYRLSTGAWLDHRVSDRFVSREEFEQACRAVFPACQVVDLGGPTRPAMIWDAPGSQGAASSWPPAVSCQSPRTLPAGSAKSATRSVPSG